MAIRIAGDTVISDTRELQLISNTDIGTSATINEAIKRQNNTLLILDSTGATVRTLYCAAENPVT